MQSSTTPSAEVPDRDPDAGTPYSGTTDTDTPDTGTDDTGTAGPAHVRTTVTMLVLAIAVLVLAVAAVWLGLVSLAGRTADDDRAGAVATARQAVVTMTTTDSTRAGESFRQLTELATGSFARQLATQSDSFVRAVQTAGVTSEGSVSEAAYVGGDDRRATVLVAADSVVQNVQVPEGEPRQYRLSLVLIKQDENWLVSELEFVA